MDSEPSEGVIKFKFTLKMTPAIEESLFLELEKWRVILFKLNFIGEYPTEKVGFGNTSRRVATGADSFIISGTQTGKFSNLKGHQYTRVTKCDLKKMSLEASGPIAPSSESLTHYSIYHSCPNINFIFHIHNSNLWNFMLNNAYPQTKKETPYGTFEMAQEVKSLIANKDQGIIAMAGHEDGIISFGRSSEEAGKIILETLKSSKQ